MLIVMVFGCSRQSTGSSSDVKKDRILRWGNYEMTDVGNLDVNLTNLNVIYQMSDMMLDTLVMKDPRTMEIKPCLADLPAISQDNLTYTFKLKQGIKFSNGDELTSEDVEFTFYRIYAPEYNGLNNWYADMITGAEDLMEGKANKLSGFEVIDKYSFRVHLDYPFSAFTAVLASSAFGIMNKKACIAAGNRWGVDTIIGTGAYKLAEFEPSVRVLFVPNSSTQTRTVPDLDGVEVILMDRNTSVLEFEAGTTDLVELSNDIAHNYRNNPRFAKNISYQEYQATAYLMLNSSIPPLNDVRVRRAISITIDPSDIVNHFLMGNVTQAHTYIPKGMVGYSDNAPKIGINVEEAKRLLVEAGYPNGITFSASQTDGSAYLDMLQIMQQQLSKANINLVIDLVDAATWMDTRRSGRMMSYCNTYTADYPDPDQFFYSIFKTEVANHRSTGLRNPGIDARINAGRLITNPAEKQAHYAALDHFIVHEHYNLRPMYYAASTLLVSERVENVFMKSDRLMSFWDAKVK